MSRSWVEVGTTAVASQVPSASTNAPRLRPSTFFAAPYPRGPRTGMAGAFAARNADFTDCVSMMPRLGSGRLPAARRRRRATSHSRRSKNPNSSHLRNQPYTVRHAGKSPGRARQGPPTRKCQATALTTGRTGVAFPLRGGSARSSHRATSSTAQVDTDVSHLDAVIRQFDPEYDLDSIRPKRPHGPDVARRGKMSRFVLGVLRGATEPMPTPDIPARFMA